jgi:hypothetical protein
MALHLSSERHSEMSPEIALRPRIAHSKLIVRTERDWVEIPPLGVSDVGDKQRDVGAMVALV